MFKLQQIADALGRPVQGDGTRVFTRAAEPSAAGPDDLALAMSPDWSKALLAGKARVAILWDGADYRDFGLEGAVTVPRARLAMARITSALDVGPRIPKGIHPTAMVDDGVILGDGVSVGPYAVIGAGARIGAHTRIGAQTIVGDGAVLGDHVLLHPQVVVGDRVLMGDRAICQPGAVIGGDGFSYVTPEESAVEQVRKTLGNRGEIVPQAHVRIHSLGSVRLGEDVEVGANTTIDRGTIADTIIGRGTKIDNLVMIGHNNRIGEDCLICSMVGVAGGGTIGDRVVLAGQVGVNDNITIGNDVVAGGATKIFSPVPDGKVILGHPAVEMDTTLSIYKALRRLPRLTEQVMELRRQVARLMRGQE
ncbi:MAG: UDP-3-O-(3-hydroxymyristoyl)glucosamine N-acyltransferase [Pseudomonadota bacterium]